MSTLDDQIKSVRQFPRAEIKAKELGAILGISDAALGSQRQRRTGPPAVVRQGCRPYYDRAEVLIWLQAQMERNARWTPPVNPDPSPE
ncbi:hypothetical protein [Bosea massiliensis]|uniref:Transcriptional regulator n=1 Tax=Bosea massiliensis TaxID=151419 RepID=A0ABW0PAR4_9HYPH